MAKSLITESVEQVTAKFQEFEVTCEVLFGKTSAQIATVTVEDVCMASRSAMTLFLDCWDVYLERHRSRAESFLENLERACEVVRSMIVRDDVVEYALYSMEQRVRMATELLSGDGPDGVLKILDEWQPPEVLLVSV